MAGDGIYSRYLTQYFGAGRYSLQLRVHDNQNSAFTLNIPQNETKTPQCCGSVISSDPKDRIPTGAFTRTTKGPVIHLLSVPPSDVDLMPPAAIRDLKIDNHRKKRHHYYSTVKPFAPNICQILLLLADFFFMKIRIKLKTFSKKKLSL